MTYQAPLQINVCLPTSVYFGDYVPLFLNIGNYSSQDNVAIAVTSAKQESESAADELG